MSRVSPADRIAERLDRARFHLDILEQDINAFLSGSSGILDIEANSETGDGVVRFSVPATPPSALSLIASDCIHNLRAALDNAIWEISLVNKRSPPPNTAFPILSKNPEHDDSAARTWNRQVGHLPACVQDRIRDLQPYREIKAQPGKHPLGQLQELSNQDKHRQFHLVNSEATNKLTIWSHYGDVEVKQGYQEHNGMIAVPFRVSPGSAQVEAALRNELLVCFDSLSPAGRSPLVVTLHGILEYIRDDVVKTLEIFLVR